MQYPLDGLLVVDFSQFLAGPSAGLRLADLGARVVKIERPDKGDLCRQLYISNIKLDGDSTLFHAINRNKQSYAANLKDANDLEKVKQLLIQADVVIENFRPGVIERLGLDYETVRAINPRIVYASISGYGREGEWSTKPGQDLLVQALSGLTWLSGEADAPPTPFGLAIADMIAGAHAVQWILACLVRRGITGEGGHIEITMMESILDFQFEVITTYLNDGGKLPKRSQVNNAHAYLAAPYGIYRTQDGHLALAMQSIVRLGQLIGNEALTRYTDEAQWFTKRDEIKRILRDHIVTETTAHWLSILEPADVWCADVLTWPQLFAHEGFRVLEMLQTTTRASGTSLETTRCPIRIDGERLTSSVGAPTIGEHNALIEQEFSLGKGVDSQA